MSDTGVRRIDHPLAAHHLAELRDVNTPPQRFRANVARLAYILCCEATRDLATEPGTVSTPLASAPAARLSQRIALVPILRAGLAMVEPMLEMIPSAEVWHLGVYRDEKTLRPVEYYHKLPPNRPPQVAMVLDPMLATGGSAVWAIDATKRWGAGRVKLLSIIAAPEGLERVRREHPDVAVYVCAIDSHLNEHGYIVPGLGDAGDRAFNTEGPRD
jgi:uracil phosphoribosyltransferase